MSPFRSNEERRLSAARRNSGTLECMECGLCFHSLISHVTRVHGLTVAGYKEKHLVPLGVRLMEEPILEKLRESNSRIEKVEFMRSLGKERAPFMKELAALGGRATADSPRPFKKDTTEKRVASGKHLKSLYPTNAFVVLYPERAKEHARQMALKSGQGFKTLRELASRAAIKARHLQWHVGRQRVKVGCPLCESS